MNLKKLLPAVVAFTLFGNVICIKGQALSSPPDLSGKWILIQGEPGATSPLGKDMGYSILLAIPIPTRKSRRTTDQNPRQ
jgi:hypothetical protein